MSQLSNPATAPQAAATFRLGSSSPAPWSGVSVALPLPTAARGSSQLVGSTIPASLEGCREHMRRLILERMTKSDVFRATWEQEWGCPWSVHRLDYQFLDAFNEHGVEIDITVPEIADSSLPVAICRPLAASQSIFDPEFLKQFTRIADGAAFDTSSLTATGVGLSGTSSAASAAGSGGNVSNSSTLADPGPGGKIAAAASESSSSSATAAAAEGQIPVPQPRLVLPRRSNVLFANNAFTEHFGWTVGALDSIGLQDARLFSAEKFELAVIQRCWEACLGAWNNDAAFPFVDFDCSVACTDGTFRWANVRMILVRGRLRYPAYSICYVRPHHLAVSGS